MPVDPSGLTNEQGTIPLDPLGLGDRGAYPLKPLSDWVAHGTTARGSVESWATGQGSTPVVGFLGGRREPQDGISERCENELATTRA